MHRLRQLMRTSTFTPLAIFLSLALRAVASLDRPIARFPDTTGYETFQFLGDIDRFWAVPFLYALVDTDVGRITLQTVIAATAWSWCALILSRMSRYPRAVLSTVLLLGVSPQVVRYDLALLSESLGISFFVLIIAASLNMRKNANPLSISVWLASVTLCAYTRPVHLWLRSLPKVQEAPQPANGATLRHQREPVLRIERGHPQASPTRLQRQPVRCCGCGLVLTVGEPGSGPGQDGAVRSPSHPTHHGKFWCAADDTV